MIAVAAVKTSNANADEKSNKPRLARETKKKMTKKEKMLSQKKTKNLASHNATKRPES